MMWSAQPTEHYQRRHKRYEKKHKRELRAVLDNLDTFLQALQEGAKPQHPHFGFIHSEPMSVLAIDQKGGGKSLAETRLYIFPDDETELVHLITLGDKRSQQNDIELCKQFVGELRARGRSSPTPEESASPQVELEAAPPRKPNSEQSGQTDDAKEIP